MGLIVLESVLISIRTAEKPINFVRCVCLLNEVNYVFRTSSSGSVRVIQFHFFYLISFSVDVGLLHKLRMRIFHLKINSKCRFLLPTTKYPLYVHSFLSVAQFKRKVGH